MKCNKVNIILTHCCNLNCKHCYMNASHNNNEDFENVFFNTKQLLFKLYDNGINEVMFTGGECTIFPKLVELINYAKEIGFKVEIFTNGMILNKEMLNLVDACYLSIDGLEIKHNFIRGNKHSFNNLLRTLDYLREIDKVTYLQFTVNNYNFNDLLGISKMLLNYLNVRKVKLVNISQEGRALNSQLKPIDLYQIKELIPTLYENTNYHIQFLSDLWSEYDIKNYYLNNIVTLPVWFDMLDNIYYIHSKDYFTKPIDKFDIAELQSKLENIILKLNNYLKIKEGQPYIDMQQTFNDIIKKGELK